MIEAEEREDGCVQVVDMDFVLHGFRAEFVSGAVSLAALDATACDPCAHCAAVVVAARRVVAIAILCDGAAEFAAPDDERLVKQPALLEILDEGRRGCVNRAGGAWQAGLEATDAFDISKESAATKALYGDTPMARQMLTARRLVEKGVRFVQVWHGGWDHHSNIAQNARRKAGEVDQPIAALIADLKQRGMLDDTLIVWSGEFGRTPRHDRGGRAEPGRDHHNRGFSGWLAGGGVKGGTVHGATDEFGYNAVQDKVHVHDLHATILALLGFDHEKLTYNYNGRNFRLTDVYGNVVKKIIA